MDWDPETLLQYLYWDCNMMAVTLQTILAHSKKTKWPMEKEVLDRLDMDISALALRLRELCKTDFSPARTVILSTPSGDPLGRARQRYILRMFRDLPEILALYSQDLHRKILTIDRSWSRDKAEWKAHAEATRHGSLYERIRAKAKQYHSVRLLRLVNAARQVQGREPIQWRAFVVWLNRLKRSSEKAKSLNAPILPTERPET